MQSRSEVNSREVTEQDEYYSPQQTSPLNHSPKSQNCSGRQMSEPPQTMSQQPEINYPENIDLEFPGSHVEQNMETNSSYQEEIMK